MKRIIVGTMTWGAWGRKFSPSEMTSLIDHCAALGLNSFDHADIYGGYTTEKEFGNSFKKSGVSRHELCHITKCGIQYPCEQRPLSVKHYNYTKTHIIASVENSLRHLHTDYLDVVLLHRPSPLMETDLIADAFSTLEKAGKVKGFGVSNFTPQQMTLLRQSVSLDWNQVECSLSASKVMFDGTLDYHQTHGIGTMAWSPLGDYFKGGEEKTPTRELLGKLSQKYSASPDQLLLAWLLQHPAKIHPVVGTTRVDRLENALSAQTISLDLEDWFAMLEANNGTPVP